jgi:hypothetical protein
VTPERGVFGISCNPQRRRREERIRVVPIMINMVVTLTPRAVWRAMQPIDETVSPSMLKR